MRLRGAIRLGVTGDRLSILDMGSAIGVQMRVDVGLLYGFATDWTVDHGGIIEEVGHKACGVRNGRIIDSLPVQTTELT